MKRFAYLAGLMLLLAVPVAAQNFSPEMTKAIQGYRLDVPKSQSIIKAQGQLSELVMQDPARMKQLAATMRMPLEDRIVQMEKDPGSMAILKANGLGARDYSVGLVALRAAAWAIQGKGGTLKGLESPANVSFLKANPSILRQFNEGEGGGMIKRPR
jgi:hypothetical protein